MIFDYHPTFGDSRCTARFEDKGWFSVQSFGPPTFDRPATEPFIFEWGELLQVLEGVDFGQWIKRQFFGFGHPERAARGWVKVPLNGLVRMLIQPLLGSSNRSSKASRSSCHFGRVPSGASTL